LIVPPFTEQFQKLLELLPKVWERLRSQLLKLQEHQAEGKWLASLFLGNDLTQQLKPLGTELFKNFLAIFSNSILVILEVLLVLVLMLMVLFNPPLYRESFLKLVPSFYRRRADEILTISEEALSSWLVGTCISSTFVGVLSGIGLYCLGINLVLVHALLAGLLNFIPNIGPTTSVIFPIMIALLDDPWKIGAIIILYLIVQNLESYLITPTIMAKQVSLLPVVTLTAQLFFTQTFGLFGLLLALPLTVVAKTCLEEVLIKDILDRWKNPPNHANLSRF
jgi:predicted PurR-regulated permease PerM